MTPHAESEADAFFRQGDEGTYAGGPASFLPTGVLDATVEDPVPAPTPEQIRRRSRFKHLVAAIITTLGAGAVLATAVRLGGNGARRIESEAVRAPAPVAVAKSEAPSSAAREFVTRTEPVATTMPVLAAMPKEEPHAEPTAIPHVGSVSADGPAAESRDIAPARTAIVPVAGPSSGNIRVSSKAPPTVVPVPKSESAKPLDKPVSAPASVHGAPPTAVFPD
jgi:hypothetical protein